MTPGIVPASWLFVFRRYLCCLLTDKDGDKVCYPGEETHNLLLTHLAEQTGIAEEDIMQISHIDVTQEFHADTVARLQPWYFPALHSLNVNLEYRRLGFAFQYYDSREFEDDGDHARPRGGRLQYDHTILQAAFTLKHLNSLNLTVPSGDCFGQFPWETMRQMKKFCSHFTSRVAQGSFGFLPRIPQLEHLQAELDFFSIPSLCCMTSLKSLYLCLALPEQGVVDVLRARERDDEVLYQLRKLTGLEKLDYCQQATLAGLLHLTHLTSLTHLTMRLPHNSEAGLRLWSVVNFFQGCDFQLQHLHFEFILDGAFAVASLDSARQLRSTSSDSVAELVFSVHWSPSQIAVRRLPGHERVMNL